MSNHVPPQVRRALSHAAGATGVEITDVHPSGNYEGAMIRVTGITASFKGTLERNGARVSGVSPENNHVVKAHIRPA